MKLRNIVELTNIFSRYTAEIGEKRMRSGFKFPAQCSYKGFESFNYGPKINLPSVATELRFLKPKLNPKSSSAGS